MNVKPGLNITSNLSKESSEEIQNPKSSDKQSAPVPETAQSPEAASALTRPEPASALTRPEPIIPIAPELTEITLPPDTDIPPIIASGKIQKPKQSDNLSRSVPETLQFQEIINVLNSPELIISTSQEFNEIILSQDADIPQNSEKIHCPLPTGLLSSQVPEITETIKNSDIPVLPESSHNRVSERPVCSNCSNPMYGNFCYACGQKEFDYKRPLHQVWSDFFDSWFSLDNKTFRSVRALFLQPGKLSSEFISGKRIHYTSPLKLFLFSSFIYFFLLGISHDNRHIQISSEPVSSNSETLPIAPVSDHATDSQMSSSNSQSTQPIDDSGVSTNGSDRQSEISTLDIAISSLDDETSILKIDIAGRSSDELKLNENVSWIETRMLELSKNPHRITSRVNKALSYMFFALMPLFALLLMIFLKGKKRLYFEHFIFSVHLHTFGFLYFSLFVLFRFFTGVPLPFAALIMPAGILLYLYLGMLHFYNMRWWVGLIRAPLITGIYLLLFITVMVSSILVSIVI